MADNDREQKNIESETPVPSDAELFAGDVQNEYSAQDIFAGDEALYQALATPTQQVRKTTPPKARKGYHQITSRLSRLPGSQFSRLQKVLASAILLVAVILTFAVFKTPRNSSAVTDLIAPPDMNTQPPLDVVIDEPNTTPVEVASAEPVLTEPDTVQEAETPTYASEDAALSLRIAQEMFEAGEYPSAYAVYHQIQQYLPPHKSESPFHDYLTLHKGLCQTMDQEFMQGRRCLSMAAKSQVPSIRVMANYHLSALELSQNQYMAARSRACGALALLDTLADQEAQWLSELKQACCYLMAEATSKQALVLCNADRLLPSDLSPTLPLIDNPWVDLDEAEIHKSMAKESDLLPSILLAPVFSSNDKKPKLPWSVSCHRMTIDELLARFGAAASMEVIWHEEANLPKLRKQAVSLHVKDVSAQTVVSLAAGSAGLLAQINEDQTIHVRNPETTSLLSDQVAMLAQEGTAMWQRYLLSTSDSPYFAIAHFMSGLLYKELALNAEALSEFKLVSTRYDRDNLAPYALLYSSQVKETLRDASGVEKDLKLLVQQYPDVPIVTNAYLRLARTVGQLGNDEEAAKLYRKLFYLNLSEESRVAASLNAGRCFYRTEEYDSAELWLTQYIQLVQNTRTKDLYPAYFILGQSLLAQGKAEMACMALRNALKGELSKEDYLQTMSSLVEGYMESQDLMEAIDVLDNAFNPKLGPADVLELRLLEAQALRGAGLSDRAIELLRNNKGAVSDLTLNARLSYELSLNLIDKGLLVEAQEELSNTLVYVESGPWAHKIALSLAQICLDLNQETQAVSVCQSILKLDPEPVLQQQAAELLAKAYTVQKDYDKAAQALLGQWN